MVSEDRDKTAGSADFERVTIFLFGTSFDLHVRITRMIESMEIRDRIMSSWFDRRVARWVISRLPLLELAGTRPECSIFQIEGTVLQQTNPSKCDGSGIVDRQKLVISGGFEGTKGHILALKEMHEVRILDNRLDGARVVLLLEPDSYIKKIKHREPLVALSQRVNLWATSGLVDAVFVAPELSDTENMPARYERIHKAISPALWCTNVENPHFKEIISRGDEVSYGLVRLFIHEPWPHISFLTGTREMSAEDVRASLRRYIAGLVANGAGRFQIPHNFSEDELEEIVEPYYRKSSKGL
ncbi:MAG: hypothetical protein ABSE04_02600 [Candidatus Microgenomates bacterium]